MKPLVEANWLAEQLDDSDLRIVDATIHLRTFPIPGIKSGLANWKRGHIPGAVYADLRKLSDPSKRSYTFTMPSAEWFAAGVGRLGIGSDTRVVIYDSRQNMWAARLWWMLRSNVFVRAALLYVGWAAWQAGGHPICSKPCSYPAATFTPQPRPDLFVGKEDVLAAIDDPATCIVNALGRRQHRGDRTIYRRRGHIATARNVTAWEILDRETQLVRAA